MNKTFADLQLNNWIVRQCEAIGICHPTPVQENCIPHILNGGDCIGCAKTGSGKTLAFALPILQKLCEDPYGIFAVILTPTRELAFQISDIFAVIGKVINLRQSVIVGGIDMVTQGQQLSKKPHVVIATPGRLADHLQSCDTFSLKHIQFLVIDEADRMMGGAFDEQLDVIFKALPKKRQTLLFSATMNDTLETLKQFATNEVLMWEAKADVATVDQLEHLYVIIPEPVRDGYLIEVLRIFREEHSDASVMVFTDTCRNCQLLSIFLNDIGFDNVALHSVMPQKERLSSLLKFKSNVTHILIATDVASRGLDMPAVELVLNYNMPNTPEDYIHRVGRTARAGRSGRAISLITPTDLDLLYDIEDLIKIKLKEYNVSVDDVAKVFTEVSVTIRQAKIKLDGCDFDEKRAINKRKKMLLEGKDPDEEFRKINRAKKAKRIKLQKLHKKTMKKTFKSLKLEPDGSEEITIVGDEKQ